MSSSGTDPVGPLRLGPIAHGGHCVTRLDGRVIFVRHGLPDELATVRITDTSRARFWWGEVARVVEPSPDRVVPPCPVAGVCGGCCFQHVALAAQRRLKARVVAEQLRRLAGIEWPVDVEPVPGDDGGLGYRTRMRYLVARGGRIGLRGWRSDEFVDVPVSGCLIAHPAGRSALAGHGFEDGQARVVVASDSLTVIGPDGAVARGPRVVVQRVGGRDYRVAADGFWQVHPGAAAALTGAMLTGLEPAARERALDLYCGAGLFAGALVDAGCRVTGVELNGAAVGFARRNVPQARFHAGRLDRLLGKLTGGTDLVVLDPPRTGAGAAVVRHLAGLNARRICYVACDPAALARDLATFGDHGYRLSTLRAFDLFPMTHHVECVAILTPGA